MQPASVRDMQLRPSQRSTQVFGEEPKAAKLYCGSEKRDGFGEVVGGAVQFGRDGVAGEENGINIDKLTPLGVSCGPPTDHSSALARTPGGIAREASSQS